MHAVTGYLRDLFTEPEAQRPAAAGPLRVAAPL